MIPNQPRFVINPSWEDLQRMQKYNNESAISHQHMVGAVFENKKLNVRNIYEICNSIESQGISVDEKLSLGFFTYVTENFYEISLKYKKNEQFWSSNVARIMTVCLTMLSQSIPAYDRDKLINEFLKTMNASIKSIPILNPEAIADCLIALQDTPWSKELEAILTNLSAHISHGADPIFLEKASRDLQAWSGALSALKRIPEGVVRDNLLIEIAKRIQNIQQEAFDECKHSRTNRIAAAEIVFNLQEGLQSSEARVRREAFETVNALLKKCNVENKISDRDFQSPQALEEAVSNAIISLLDKQVTRASDHERIYITIEIDELSLELATYLVSLVVVDGYGLDLICGGKKDAPPTISVKILCGDSSPQFFYEDNPKKLAVKEIIENAPEITNKTWKYACSYGMVKLEIERGQPEFDATPTEGGSNSQRKNRTPSEKGGKSESDKFYPPSHVEPQAETVLPTPKPPRRNRNVTIN